jgi:hypothetical protein
MSFELNLGAGGDAAVDAPAATEAPASSETVSGGSDTPIATPISTDSGATPPADQSLTTEPTVNSEPPPAAEPAPASPEDEEAALQAAANDPNTPQWAREQIKKAMGYAGRLKEAKSQAEMQATELRSQYEGKEVLPPDELTRMRANDEKLLAMSSITSKPEDIISTMRELNPRAYPEVQNKLVWDALTKPDGTPNYDNLQTLVDSFAGEAGKVSAKDVIQAITALKTGALNREDIHNFGTTEEFEAWQRQQASEAEWNAKNAQITETAKYQEQQIRQQELGGAISQVQQQLDTQISGLLDKFKLGSVPNEPKVAADYKARVNELIKQAVVNAPREIREFSELTKALEIIGKPGEKPVDAQSAIAEVKSFLNSPSYQQIVAKGLSTLMTNIERTVAQEARFYALMNKGYELEASQAQNARPVLGQPNQATTGLPNLTEADLARMSAAERRDYSARQLTEGLRQLQNGQVSRMGA